MVFTVFLLLPFQSTTQSKGDSDLRDGTAIADSDKKNTEGSQFDDSLKWFTRETMGPHHGQHKVFFEPTKPASEAFKKECGLYTLILKTQWRNTLQALLGLITATTIWER